MATFTSWIVFSLLLLQFSFTLFNFNQLKLAHAIEPCSSSSSGNVTNALEEEGMKLYPLINKDKVKKMMVMNETRRKLGSFQICAPCTCCGAKGYCLPSPCCYAINCNIPNRPFGFCSFTPKVCNCLRCHI
ncbi:Chaperone protein DnaJ [Bienertia sinuspersici]